MSNSTDYQSSQSSNVDSSKSGAEDSQAKLNGLDEGSEHKQNGISEKHSSSPSKKSSDGHHKSSSDKHRSTSSSKHGSSSSSSSKHKDGHSSSKHRDSSSSSKHRESSSSKHSSSSSSSKPKDGHKSSSSSHRDKDGKSSSSSSSSRHKDGHSSSSKHSSSSSSSKHRDGSSHSSSKDRSSDKDKHREKGKESSSSSSKDREKHKSSSSSSHDKHRSSSDKHKSSSDKHKASGDSSSKSDEKVKVKEEVQLNNSSNYEEPFAEVKTEPPSSTVKSEPQSPVKKEYSPVKKEAPVVKSEEDEEQESSEDEDKPLSVRINQSRPQKRVKEESDYEDENEDDEEEDDDEDVPLLARAKQAKKQKLDQKPVPVPVVKKETKAVKKEKASTSKRKAANDQPTGSPVKKKKKEEEEQEVWRWWEEQSLEDTGKKWTFLEHRGPLFAPLYEPLPKNVRFYYEGKPMELSQPTEEVGTFYGRMLDHDYTTKDVFNGNFFKDWRKVMTEEEKKKITDLKKCNFVEYNDHFKKKSEERKAMSKEEKQRIKKENEEITKEYGFCLIDKHKEKIGNFRIEPPSLFRGRGDHPKQGMLKRRVMPEDVIINCSKDSNVPKAPDGHKWKEVRHDNLVTWLASWTENIQGATKYVMLNAASKLKGQKDWQKYELARKLHKCVDKIRANYQEDWKSKEMRVRQRSVALYFIDKLALRAGNEKDGEESADTVGCCSLRVEHIKLHEEKGGKQYVVEFDFLGKDSIRYQNAIPVEKRVFKNVQLFMENKSPEDDLFDRLNTVILNKHLQDLMEGLTAKVFRTYNASRTLSEQLELLTNSNDLPAAKMLSYNRANRAVAILCNHQRAVPKTFEKTMENLQKKIDSKNEEIKSVKKEIKGIKADYKQQKSVKTKTLYEKKKKTLARLEDQLTKLEVDATDKDENKEIALGTSKLNYLDPRISVAWCKKFEVPIEKVYNKTQRDKFRWAIDMATEHFKF